MYLGGKERTNMLKKLFIEIGENKIEIKEENDWLKIKCIYCNELFVFDFMSLVKIVEGLNISKDGFDRVLKHNCSKMKKKK